MARRSAQTVLHIHLDALARLMAPILAFTAEEIWDFMPEQDGKAKSVHLTSLPEINASWKDEKLAKTWKRILEVRGEVTKALEEARANKRIGHSLDAAVTIDADNPLYDELYPYADHLGFMFIVSNLSLTKNNKPSGAFESDDIEGLSILVEPAAGDKCERCWIYDPSVGTSSEHPTICHRCRGVLSELDVA